MLRLPSGVVWVWWIVAVWLFTGVATAEAGPGAPALVAGDRDGSLMIVGKPAVFGKAPLTSTVTAKRRGSVLKLDYALTDAGGRKPSASERGERPSFRVYLDDREIGSGSFEYG